MFCPQMGSFFFLSIMYNQIQQFYLKKKKSKKQSRKCSLSEHLRNGVSEWKGNLASTALGPWSLLLWAIISPLITLFVFYGYQYCYVWSLQQLMIPQGLLEKYAVPPPPYSPHSWFPIHQRQPLSNLLTNWSFCLIYL